MIGDKRSNQFRLEILGIAVRCLSPCDQELIVVSQLPDVSATPMTNSIAGSVPTVFSESLLRPRRPEAPRARLADVEHGRIADPRCFQNALGNRRVLALEPASVADIEEGHPVGGFTQNDVDACPPVGTGDDGRSPNLANPSNPAPVNP